ncbi:MAG: hypothetical protein D6784_10670 [Chloroflexi bacterium]|nr:MAG: hypothetical protein D6784_10670 [Chloroflexota bacterium]
MDRLTPLLYDSLWQVDPQTAALRPGLAQGWEYSADGLSLTFHLPPGLRWSSGEPLTALQLVNSLQASEHPTLRAFSQITAPDPRTLTLTFARIDCAAATAIGLLPLVHPDTLEAAVPVGSGPFVAEGWAGPDRTLTLHRNPYYRGPGPRLDGVSVRFLSADEVAVAATEAAFDVLGPLPAGETPTASPALQRLAYPSGQMVYIALNYAPKNEPPLPPEVRRALTLALDRPAVLSDTLAGEGQLLAGPLLPGHWAAVDSLTPPDYNPAAARDLLAQAGLRDTDGDGWLDQNGKRFELSIRLNAENPLHQKLGWLVSSYYRDLGLYARAEGVPAESLVDDLFTHDFQAAVFAWPARPDPDQRAFWLSTQAEAGAGLNLVSFQDAQVDDLLAQAVAVPGCQPETRAGLYARLQKILAQARPVDFLLAPNHTLLVSNRVRGLSPGPFAPFTWNIGDWGVEIGD